MKSLELISCLLMSISLKINLIVDLKKGILLFAMYLDTIYKRIFVDV